MLKLAGEPGGTVAVAVDAFGLDSVPSAICAVAPKVCTPDFSGSNPLVPVIPVTALVDPAGAGTENNFTGVPVVTSYTLNCRTQFVLTLAEHAGVFLKS